MEFAGAIWKLKGRRRTRARVWALGSLDAEGGFRKACKSRKRVVRTDAWLMRSKVAPLKALTHQVWNTQWLHPNGGDKAMERQFQDFSLE